MDLSSLPRRALGGLLILLCLSPLYLLLDPGAVGPFGESTRQMGAANLAWAWWGTVGVGATAALLAALIPARRLGPGLQRIGAGLRRPPTPVFAALAGLASTALAGAATRILFRGLPTSVDEIASLLQARYMAAGALAGPVPVPPGAFVFRNTLLVPEGWVSLYPPSHLMALAGGLALGAVWVVPPILVGVTVVATSVSAERLLGPEHQVEARLGSILLALSPFVVILGGTYLSHVSAAAGIAMALAFGLLAREGGWGWAVAAGAAVGLAVTSRPWTGLVLGTALTAGLWGAAWMRRDRCAGWCLGRLAAWSAGGLPFAAAWLLYNRHFFGGPLRLGYEYAYGRAHGLGFHRDPWGNIYGPVEALGYTSTQLTALGLQLLETPFPLVLVVGAWLLVARRLPRGTGVIVTWAVLPLAANFFYWHHGFHLGPRMLYEAAPAWAVLVALAGVGLVGVGEPGIEGAPEKATIRARRMVVPSPRDVVLWALLLAAVSAPILALERAASYAHTEEQLARFTAPPVPGPEPALVFVHGSWAERLGAQLQANGMTLDSLESALRRNDICQVQEYVTARVEEGRSDSELPPLDFAPRPGTPPGLRSVLLSPGNRVRVDPERPRTPRCRLEAFSDRLGVVSLAPLAWQGDLPGIRDGAPLFLRDLGPRGNSDALARHRDRKAWMYFQPDTGSVPILRPYEEGMRTLWGRGLSAPPGR